MPTPRKTYLFLIGIDEYQYWKPLSYPVSDCKQFFQTLEEHYGFTEESLIHMDRKPLFNRDATRDFIYDELYRLSDDKGNEDQTPVIGPNDNLIIYFAGHGYLDKKMDSGFWIAHDTPAANGSASEFNKHTISESDIQKLLFPIKAHHIVLIVDACFSLKFAHVELPIKHEDETENTENKPSRWVFTSGRLEPVLDDGHFSAILCETLANYPEPSISIRTLGDAVQNKIRVTGFQNAWCCPISFNRHHGGEFVFHRTGTVPRPAGAVIEIVPQQEALLEKLRLGSHTYRQRLLEGRFKRLRIEELLLPQTKLPNFVEVQVLNNGQESLLIESIDPLWGKEHPHAVILGDGGMGKTVSLLRIWEDGLKNTTATVPVFIALNEYNSTSDTQREDFILRRIAQTCGLAEDLTPEWKNALWNLIRNPLPNGKPAIRLLLDGFNEVTSNSAQLLVELNQLTQRARGLHIVVTSRFVEIQHYEWIHSSHILYLQPLEHQKIQDYLAQMKFLMPEDVALQQLLSIPMMLTLYCGSSESARKYATDARFVFLPNKSVGELLWNFTEAQLAQCYADFEHDLDEQIWRRFLIRCLLPYLAYRMEKEGEFFLCNRRRTNPAFNFQKLVEEAYNSLNISALTEVYPEFEGKRALLGFLKNSDPDVLEERGRRVRNYLVNKLHLLLFEGEDLRFLHQNFRDFFAACHLLNVIDFQEREIPASWTDRAFPVYIRQFLGEIEGEHHFDASHFAAGHSIPGFKQANRLAAVLERCKGRFSQMEIQVAILNAVKSISDTRGSLAGANLEWLDLGAVNFNGICMTEHLGNYKYLSSKFTKSLLKGKQFLSQGHSDLVNHACYSPDAKKILSVSDDKTIKEWSVASGQCLQNFQGHSGAVWSVCYSLDGKKILSASNDHTIKEWSVDSGQCLRTFQGHSDSVNSACYSIDGKKILSTSSDETIKEWSIDSGQCIQTFQGHSDWVRSACYSSDGKKILSTSDDNTIKEWSATSGQCLQTFQGHSNWVKSACYSSNGEKILSASHDSTIKEWSVASGQCLQTLKGHSDFVGNACYNSDGKTILSASKDKTIKEWSVDSGQCLQTLKGHSDSVKSACYSLDGRKILSASTDQTIKEWAVHSGQCLQTIQGHSDSVNSVCYSLDGKKILFASDDKTIKEWSVDTGQCLRTFQGHSNSVLSVCYSSDEKRILSASSDTTIKEWSVDTGQCLRTISGHSSPVRSVCYSLDGKKILSASVDKTIKEWSADSGQCLRTFQGHSDSVNSICYSLDGKKILSASEDKTIKEWSADTGECLQTFQGHSDSVNSARYSLDGKKILSSSVDKTIKEWSVNSRQCLQTFRGHSSWVLSACYSADGKKILSASFDQTIKEWAVNSGHCLQTLKGHFEYIRSACYSLDGEKILSTSYKKTVKEWSVHTGECLRTYTNECGLYLWACDFTNLHPESEFTKEEVELLKMYGAIFV